MSSYGGDDSNISRVFLDGQAPRLRCRVKVVLFRSGQYQMSRKFWQLRVGKEVWAKVQLRVSASPLSAGDILIENNS